jgi:hypothetical protein
VTKTTYKRRSPDPARWRCLDSHRVGDRRSNRQAILPAALNRRVTLCDTLDTIVAFGFFSYFHVYSPILTYSHIKKYFIFHAPQPIKDLELSTGFAVMFRRSRSRAFSWPKIRVAVNHFHRG